MLNYCKGLLLATSILSIPICALTPCNYPGGIATLKVPCHTQVFFHNTNVLVINRQRKCIALIGIPLTDTKNNDKIAIKYPHETIYKNFNIKAKRYKAEHFTLKKRGYVKTPAKLMRRIRRERKIINQAFNHWSNKLYTNLKFSLPAKGRFSSPFGLRRFVNGKLSGRHRGLDIAARRGTRVRAPATGYVLAAGKYYLTGNTVIIDHGRGLVTLYCHLSKIYAKPGKIIRKGRVLGLIGSTGRSTGPHLHWGANLNHNRINPLLLLQLRRRIAKV